MATNFPISLDAFTNPTAVDTLDSPPHDVQHADANDAIEALQTKVGVDGSAVTDSLDYKVANFTNKLGSGSGDTYPWAAGAELTATDLNAAFGSVLIASGTFSDVASFDVTGFSASFDFYQMFIFADKATAGSVDITGQIRSGGTARTGNYYGATFYSAFDASGPGYQANRSNGSNFYLTSAAHTFGSHVSATVHGIGNSDFTINLQAMDTALTRALYGSYTNYDATSSFDNIRFTGTANITGYWTLTGMAK